MIRQVIYIKVIRSPSWTSNNCLSNWGFGGYSLMKLTNFKSRLSQSPSVAGWVHVCQLHLVYLLEILLRYRLQKNVCKTTPSLSICSHMSWQPFGGMSGGVQSIQYRCTDVQMYRFTDVQMSESPRQVIPTGELHHSSSHCLIRYYQD